jgi:hypothetical protein
MADLDYQTRFFKLDTRDSTFQSQTYYAAWRPTKTVLFLIDDNGRATVLYVMRYVRSDEIRGKVQRGPDGWNGSGITDVVGIEELDRRPDFNAVDVSQVADRDDEISVTEIGNILEAGYIDE